MIIIIFRDFEIQTDHQIQTRRADLLLINKKKRTCQKVDFTVPTGYRIKVKKGKRQENYIGIVRKLKRL